MLANIIYVGIGGFLGAVCRYLGNLGVARLSVLWGFPIGTLLVNLTGCFLIGLLAFWGESKNVFSPHLRLFVFVGFLGSFTTFSSFGHETLALARAQMPWAALANVVLHIVLGLAFVWLGLFAGKLFLR